MRGALSSCLSVVVHAGFGIGWFNPEERREHDPTPCVFTSITPAWCGGGRGCGRGAREGARGRGRGVEGGQSSGVPMGIWALDTPTGTSARGVG